MRVWDLPLRIFHWALVVAVIGAVVSSKAEVMWLHERFGLSVMGLVAFRLIWGFVGGYYARFRQFVTCLLYTSPSPRDRTRSRMPSSA